MNIIHLELLNLTRTDDQRCIGDICMHGDQGERIQIQCNIDGHSSMGRRALNGALAQDALRQLKRMPELRKHAFGVAKRAMPRGPRQRTIRLTG